MIPFVQDDGGRAAAGFKGRTGDCVVRSIAIAAGRPYATVYAELARILQNDPRNAALGGEHTSPRNGVPRRLYEPYLRSLGFRWVPTMQVGQGCKVHLRAAELPKGRLVARCSRHLVAVIDGVMHDTFDASRGGTRCVYGYFIQEAP